MRVSLTDWDGTKDEGGGYGLCAHTAFAVAAVDAGDAEGSVRATFVFGCVLLTSSGSRYSSPLFNTVL